MQKMKESTESINSSHSRAIKDSEACSMHTMIHDINLVHDSQIRAMGESQVVVFKDLLRHFRGRRHHLMWLGSKLQKHQGPTLFRKLSHGLVRSRAEEIHIMTDDGPLTLRTWRQPHPAVAQ